MPSEAAEATVVAVDSMAEGVVDSAAAEASAAVDFAVAGMEGSAEDMAATDMAGSGAAIGAASDLASVGAGPGITDTLTIMDIPTLTDIPVTTDTIPMLMPDSKHIDPMLRIRRPLLPTAAQ